MPEIVAIQRVLMTPFGEAEADLIWIPDGFDHASEYCCWLLETGENWWFPQPLVRAMQSVSTRRGSPSPIVLPHSFMARYAVHIARHTRSPFYAQATAYLESKNGSRAS